MGDIARAYRRRFAANPKATIDPARPMADSFSSYVITHRTEHEAVP